MGKASRTKQERQQSVTEQKQRASKSNIWFGAIIAAVLVLGGILAVIAFTGKSDEPADAVAAPVGTEELDGASLSRNHVDNPTYDHPVPAGGSHIGIWQNCGVYREPQNTGNLVHSLEHGAVWISYSPDLADQERETLEGLTDRDPFVVVAPNPDVDAGEIWASAWGYRLQASSADDPRLAEFVDEFARGPQTPEPGAGCTGGVGRPV